MLFREFNSLIVLQTTLPLPFTLRPWTMTILTVIHDRRFPPRYTLDLYSSGMLRSVDGKLVTYVLHCLTLQDGADRLSRNVDKYNLRCVISQNSKDTNGNSLCA